MKKIIFALVRTKLVFMIIASTVLLFSSAYPSEAQDSDFEYIIENSGITITGWKGNGNNIIIPEAINGSPVIKIGENVFNLFDINLNVAPTSRKRIYSVVIPNSIVEIGQSAFAYCNELTNITLPENLKIIGSAAFVGCTRLTKITIPDSVEEIGAYAFSKCRLTEVILPNSVLKIEEATYSENRITHLFLPEHLTHIEHEAFYGNPLTAITIPVNVNVVRNAFPDGFSVWYTKTGSQAGVYNLNNGRWTLEGRSLSYGIIEAENGAYLSMVNDDDKINNYTISDRRYLLAPGTYDIGVKYKLDGHVSLSIVHLNITVKSGKYYSVKANTSDGRIRYTVKEE